MGCFMADLLGNRGKETAENVWADKFVCLKLMDGYFSVLIMYVIYNTYIPAHTRTHTFWKGYF